MITAEPHIEPIPRPAWMRFGSRVLKTTGAALIGGALAGGLAGGIGSRVAMRIAGASEPRCARLVTENGNNCGAFTGDGTLFLLLFGALFFGAPGGLLYLGLRSWLARLGAWRGAAFGLLVLAAAGWSVLDPHNVDFDRFGSPVLNVVMFSVIFVAFGVAVAPLVDAVDRLVPETPPLRPFRPWPTATYAVAAAPPALALFALSVGTGGLALLVLGFLPVVSALPRFASGRPLGVRVAAMLVAGAPLVVGGAVTVRNVFQIVG